MKSNQFSLRMLLAAVAVVGVGATFWTAEPSWQVGAIEFVFLGWILASSFVLSVRAKRAEKAWWIGIATACTLVTFLYFTVLGALAGASINVMVFESDTPLDPLQWIAHCLSFNYRALVVAWAFAPVVGLLCVFTHWLLIRPPEPKA